MLNIVSMFGGDHTSGQTRRRLLKAALVAGGASSLSACLDITGGLDVPTGTTDIDSYPQSQHAWNDALVIDPHGNTVAPHYQLLLFLNYEGSIPPTEAERESVKSCLRGIERAFQRGTGADLDALSLNGLLTLIGYSPDYFDRFDEPLPDSIDLPSPESVLSAINEDPSKGDHYDAVVILTSDRVEILLAAEQAIRGNRRSVNGTEIPAAMAETFSVADRRTGFKGEPVVSRKLADAADVDDVPTESPSAMGYKSGFTENQATEERVTIDEGPFAGGTTLHISRLTIDLTSWYDLEESDRVDRMFSPDHTPEQVGKVGKFLASDSRINEDVAAETTEHATTAGVVGHTQKLARARDDDFRPKILRRSEAISLDDISENGTVGFNFTSLQREIADFVETRRAMTFVEEDERGSADKRGCPVHGSTDTTDTESCPVDNGILAFLETEHRANFLVPPREKRALPAPQE